MTRLRIASAVLAVCLLLGLGACGGDDEEATTAAPTPTGATGPTAQSATGATGAAEDEPAPPEPSPTTSTAPPAEPTRPGQPGPGDEEPIRQPASFEVGGEDVKPSSISVSPFLAIALKLENVGTTPLIVRLVGTDATVELAPGQKKTRRLKGLKAGLYTLSVNDGAQVGTVVVGNDVGP